MFFPKQLAIFHPNHSFGWIQLVFIFPMINIELFISFIVSLDLSKFNFLSQ